VFCATDLPALGLMQVVPGDLAVVGYDGAGAAVSLT